MRPTAIRILKHGLPAAMVLGVLGYGMAEVAGMWVNAQQPAPTNRELLEPTDEPQNPTHGEEIAQAMRWRLPFTMAAWGFGLVVALELLRRMYQGNPTPKPAAPPPPLNPDEEVEKLLNQLLEQAEAAKAARANPPITEPPPP